MVAPRSSAVRVARIVAQLAVLASSLASAAAHGQSMPMHDHAAMERLGNVNFPTSCKPATQPSFDRALALMHSFQFGPASDGFQAVLAADPSCAIAYWGIALSRWSNPFAGFKSPAQIAQGLAAVERGRALGTGSPREKAYLEAVALLYVDAGSRDQQARYSAYAAAMERLSAAYPDDVEASIFYALALAADADPADKSYAKQLKAGALLEALFRRFPDHPGLAHYIIHAYDVPALAAHARQAALRYAEIAPSTPHALHMPSHTFTRTGDWQASIATNRASAAAARAAGQPADELHASDYMVYGYLQTGQDRAAKELVDASAAAFSRFDPANANGAAPASAAYFAHAAIPARYALERHDWSGAAALAPLATRFPYADAITYFARGLGAARVKDVTGADAAIAKLESLRASLAQMGEDYWAGQVEVERREVVGVLAFATGDTHRALTELRSAADAEDKTEIASVAPGPVVPARELLADVLLETGQPAEALTQYEAALKREPNRFWSLYGATRAAKRAGKTAIAFSYAKQLRAVSASADRPGRPLER